ncbi:MAG: hypothetical protein KF687_07970 [Cyclobacteriaceae bacterium]|nr:hypothetical protein [Cyclobacteriaceae bacterium]
MLRIFPLIILISWLFACRAPQPVYSYQESTLPKKGSGRFSILSFRIAEDSLSQTTVTLLDEHYIDGNLKGEHNDSDAENILLIKQEDAQLQVVDQTTLDHPLIKYVEYVNERQEFETKLVTQHEAEFFIRIELKPQTLYIRIDEVREGKELQLAQFKIR